MSSQMPLRGAVDLSALASRNAPRPVSTGQPAGQPAGPGAGPTSSPVVVEVDEAGFQSAVIDLSMTVPVIIDFWATWCQPCTTLTPILEKVVLAAGGRLVLAKIDVDASQRIAAAFQVQSIPSVFAVLKGQPIPLFQGALPEAQVARYFDELLRVAAQEGVTGSVPTGDAPEVQVAEPPEDPRFVAASEAIEAGNWDEAAAAYRAVLAEAPADVDARAGLALVGLLARTEGVDPAAATAAADADPDDLDAQLLAADAAVLEQQVDAGFARIIDVIRRTSGSDRDRVRTHLLDLFEVVGSADPAVVRGRAALASALF